jgi:hypothetical protein
VITERLNGETAQRELPILMRFVKEGMVAGRIHFLKPIAPQEMTAPGSTDGVEVLLKSEFRAQQGDVIVASGRVGTFALSAHTLD